jgi:ABC-type cobalamin/Fe3+-siderophores transport system ATPase subunit
MTTPVLQVRDLGWRGPESAAPVLAQVSFEVRAGEFVAVMGRNGAGKSTLLDLIAGLRTPTEGALVLAGRPLMDWTAIERARVLAHLPQHVRADLAMRAEALVLMGRYPHAAGWFESASDRRIAREAMQRCDCLSFRDRLLSTMSGGERQRVFLAACLAQQARLVLLDEPATFLDVDQQLECFGVLRGEADRGAACLAVTHDVNLALTFCTRLIVLADGGVARDLAVGDALANPSWLGAFSRRLIVEHGPSGAWVRYQ